MDKKLYFAPEMETLEVEFKNAVLTASDGLEEPTIGGSEQGYSDQPFNPGA